MNKFENLPVGTRIEFTEKTQMILAHGGYRNPSIVSVDGIDKDYYFTKTGGHYLFKPEYIQRIISYPIDRDKLKPGVKVKLRDDLVQWKEYGSFGWNWNEAMRMDKCVVTEIDHDTITIKGKEGYGYSAEMFECEIKEELVDGIEAWNQMKQGKYASHGDWLGKIVDGKLHKTHKANDKPWKFVRSNVHLNQFMEGEYRILDELPDWAQELKNPFKIGQLVYSVCNEGVREVVEIIDHEHFKAMTFDGQHGNNRRWTKHYRPATQEEELSYWRDRARYLEGS